MTVDLSTVPLVALSTVSKQLISTLLNPPKVIPNENGLPRDWRGLAHLSNLRGEFMPSLASHADPSLYILNIWEQRQKGVTIKDLQAIFEQLDRWDIVDDTAALFDQDAEKYLSNVEKSQTSATIVENQIDDKVLTVADLHRFRQGLESQYYDAFLLYADEDYHFANEMIEKLENQHKLKLCIKDRDLIGGITFEHEAVMTLISERCNRLIVIVSSSFLKSPANKFFLNYAQALGIDKRQRKVIPCLYEKCTLPPQLSYMFILDYNRVGLYDFWGKLRDSVQTPNPTSSVKEDLKENSTRVEKENREDNIDLNKYYEYDTNKIDRFVPVKMSNTEAPLKNLTTNVLDKVQDSNDGSTTTCTKDRSLSKKHNNLLEWTKKKLNRKSDSTKNDYQSISETLTLPSLPSLDGLDALDISSEITEKKPKTKFINKYIKKIQLKKVLVKS